MRDVAVTAAQFLRAHVAERITLADVADHVGYSPFHLARTFERRLGVPPGQFLAAQRFQRAKELLLADNDKVVDVCFAVGFTSVGTFTRRFAAAVGVSPTEFRRLPDALAASPPRPVAVPGAAPRGGVVVGAVRLSTAAAVALGDHVAIYVGLFTRRAACGLPVSGSLLGPTREFMLTDVPPGQYWVLASALPARADSLAQLVPLQGVQGAAVRPVRVTAQEPWHYRDVFLDVAADWSLPVLVALPPLASPGRKIGEDAGRRAV